jgi:hypothetical protein
MALDRMIIVNAMTANLSGTPSEAQMNSINAFADAMVSFVQGATVVYDGASLLSASAGSPVTEAIPTQSGLTLE